eukprot:3322552-Pleurochrysis_carterae.AAC.1
MMHRSSETGGSLESRCRGEEEEGRRECERCQGSGCKRESGKAEEATGLEGPTEERGKQEGLKGWREGGVEGVGRGKGRERGRAGSARARGSRRDSEGARIRGDEIAQARARAGADRKRRASWQRGRRATGRTLAAQCRRGASRPGSPS